MNEAVALWQVGRCVLERKEGEENGFIEWHLSQTFKFSSICLCHKIKPFIQLVYVFIADV